MRIIGGRLKRAALKAPKGLSVRPTTDKVREALFNALRARIPIDGTLVLDLFAGTGALGFEALSRGAERAVFVEDDASVLSVTKANASALGLEEACTFVRSDVLKWLRRPVRQRFDLIFADPPYGLEDLQVLPGLAQPHLAEDGLFVLEHDARHAFDGEPSLMMSKSYGRTAISMFVP